MIKTDNGDLRAKLALRRWFLRRYHAETPPIVLDCCQGAGLLWDRLRAEFDVRYQGADVRPRRPGIKVDSVRLFDVPAWPYEVVDIDTWGEPWKHYERLCRTADHPVTVFLTVGLIRPNGFGANASAYVRRAMGVPRETPGALVANVATGMLDRLIWYPLGRLRLVQCIEAPAKGNARYLGLRLEPRESA